MCPLSQHWLNTHYGYWQCVFSRCSWGERQGQVQSYPGSHEDGSRNRMKKVRVWTESQRNQLCFSYCSTLEYSFKVALACSQPQVFEHPIIPNCSWNLLVITEVLALVEEKDAWLSLRSMWNFDCVLAPLTKESLHCQLEGVAIHCQEDLVAL